MLESIFQDTSQRVLSKYNLQLREINNIGNTIKNFTDSELQKKAQELKQRILSGEPIDNVTNEAFALESLSKLKNV